MRVPIEIETHDGRLAFDIAGRGSSLTAGTAVDAPGNVSISYEGSLVRKAFGIPEILHFVVQASVNVDLALFAAWLYDKVKNRPVERLVINRTEVVEISAEGIRKCLETEISMREEE